MQDYNQKFKNVTESFKKFFSNLGKVAIIITAIASGYAASEIYTRYTLSVKAHQMQEPKKFAETSAAINERGELLIIDRKTGTYQVFDNEVGKVIFDLYASKIYYNQNNPK